MGGILHHTTLVSGHRPSFGCCPVAHGKSVLRALCEMRTGLSPFGWSPGNWGGGSKHARDRAQCPLPPNPCIPLPPSAMHQRCAAFDRAIHFWFRGFFGVRVRDMCHRRRHLDRATALRGPDLLTPGNRVTAPFQSEPDQPCAGARVTLCVWGWGGGGGGGVALL